MKNNLAGYLSALAFALLPLLCYAQAPQSFNYQFVVRDGSGEIVQDQTVGIKTAILKDEVIIYEETYTPRSSGYGQISVQVGTGNSAQGDFKTIDWSAGKFMIQYAIDLNGGDNYTISGVTPLYSIPYALFTNSTQGVLCKTSQERDLITSPKTASILFCLNCGVNGQFQVYNGTKWTDAIGANGASEVLAQTISVFIRDVSSLDEALPDNSIPLDIQAEPLGLTLKNVSWSSDNEDIATVDAAGIVLVKTAGSVTITATATDGSNVSGSLGLMFEDEKPATAAYEGLLITGDTLSLVGEERPMFALLQPFSELDQAATWTSLDPNVATVDAEGVVTALAIGIARITAQSSEGSAFKDTMSMMVITQEMPDLDFPVMVIEMYDGVNALRFQRLTNVQLPTATAMDDIDGDVAVQVRLDATFNPNPFVDTGIADYRVIYTSSDAAGNTVIDSVIVSIVDTVAPVIVLDAPFTVGDTIYADNRSVTAIPTATASDDNGDAITVNTIPGSFTGSNVGFFTVQYEATDAHGNTGKDSMYIWINDSIPPTITIAGSVMPGDTSFVPQGTSFDIPQASAQDDDGATISVMTDDGGLDINELGVYTIKYQASDSTGNIQVIEFFVKVEDTTPPVIDNKMALQLTSSSFVVGGSAVLAMVEASDNIGITSYEVFDLGSIGLGGGENWEGSLDINNNGVITVGDPNGNAFEANFFFRIIVRDAVGLKDSVDVEFVFSRGGLRDIRVKEFEELDWIARGQAYDDPLPYSYDLRESTYVGDTILIFTATSNAFTLFNQLEFDPVAPGAGSADFEILNGGNDIFYIRLVLPLDNDFQASYNLNLDVVTSNTLDPTLINRIPFIVNITVLSSREFAPTLNVEFPVATYGEDLTVGSFLNNLAGSINGVACPLSSANDILGDLAEGLDQLIDGIPIISENEAQYVAKRIMQKLPAYFWLRKEGNKTRLNMKIPFKTKNLVIEYVIDPDRGGCYWRALLEGLEPSKIHPKLSALDNNTNAGVVVNTLSVSDKDFKCIRIPCLVLSPGAHIVATGKPIPYESGASVATAILEPTVFAVVTPLSSGFDDPALTVTYGLKADFKTEMDKEMISRMDLGSAAAQTGIALAKKGIQQAKNQLNSAAARLNFDLGYLNRVSGEVARVANVVKDLQEVADYYNDIVGPLSSAITGALLSDEICTPSFCALPCYYPGWCSRSCGFFTCGYPCLRSCGCGLRIPEVCVPSPVALLAAAGLEDEIAPWRRLLAGAIGRLNHYKNKLDQLKSQKISAETIVANAEAAVSQATQGISDAQNGLSGFVGDNKPFSDVANFIGDNLINKTVATSKATFVTTLASANNGTYTGQLTIDMRILSSPTVTLTLPQYKFTGAGIESSLSSLYNLVLNQIP